MESTDVPLCGCPTSQGSGDAPERPWHRRLILVLSRLNEQWLRWVAALEANRLGRGGETLVAQITAPDEKTIGRGREELAASPVDRLPDRVRLTGGDGRPSK